MKIPRVSSPARIIFRFPLLRVEELRMRDECISVVKNLYVERITGEDGFFESPLKFTNEGSIKDSWTKKLHEAEEMFFIIGEFPLHIREIVTTVMNIVRGKSGNILNKQCCSLSKKTVLLNRFIEIHFHRLHRLSSLKG